MCVQTFASAFFIFAYTSIFHFICDVLFERNSVKYTFIFTESESHCAKAEQIKAAPIAFFIELDFSLFRAKFDVPCALSAASFRVDSAYGSFC